MKFARIVSGSLLLASCVIGQPSEELPSDSGTGSDASTVDDAKSEALPAAPKPRSERLPWVESADPIGQRYPAYGVTLYHMAYVYEQPSKSARVVGYLRRGSRFRASEEVTRKECARGWFEVPGEGFVCQGDGFLVDSEPPAYEDAPRPAALAESLPYAYAKVVSADVPQYMRLPTPDEERSMLETFAAYPVVMPSGDEAATAASPPPESPSLPPEVASLLRLRMQPGFYVSVDRDHVDGARSFVRTVRGGFVRKDQVIDAKLPDGIGVALGHSYMLPLAFVYRGGAPVLRLDPITGEAVKVGGNLELHSAHVLTGETVVRSGRSYFVSEEGLLLRDTAVRVVDKVARPKILSRSERWIRVDLARQTLTAYEGDEPVFATLVSSGLADHATPTGIFRLHAKHVTATMADDMASDGPYSIEDVPWTMYFSGSYALHAAFWHERFGHPRSHGCVNLAPRDARWLFFWTAPELPSSWHGILAGIGEGTTVVLDTDSTYEFEAN